MFNPVGNREPPGFLEGGGPTMAAQGEETPCPLGLWAIVVIGLAKVEVKDALRVLLLSQNVPLRSFLVFLGVPARHWARTPSTPHEITDSFLERLGQYTAPPTGL